MQPLAPIGRRAGILRLAALLFLATAHAAGGGAPAVHPDLPGEELDRPVLFEAVFPVQDLLPSGWTRAQREEVLSLLRRMQQDDRIFLIVQTTVDPIGSREENEIWALGVSQAVAARLRDSGIRADRILIVAGAEDSRLFDEPRWEGFLRRQSVSVKGLRGGDWLKRHERPPAPLRASPPAEGVIRIVEPAEGKTERARHILRGDTERSVRTVSIALGSETQTAAVYGGRFEVPIFLKPGENRISVTGLDGFGRALRASRSLVYVPPVPTIDMASPEKGAVFDLSRSPVVKVRGTVRSRHPLADAFLVQNDTPRPIRVLRDGGFEQEAVLITEEDVFTVEAVDREGLTGVSEPRRVRSRGIAERPLLAILHWDEDDVDLDLHIRDSEGRHTYFEAADVLQSATAIPSGKLWLDNRGGFGPEAFTLEKTVAGEFSFSVEYYRGRKGCRAYLTLVLFAGSPSRTMVRKVGPIAMSPGERRVALVTVTLPDGIVREPQRDDRRER